MAENTYQVRKSDDGKIIDVRADHPILDPNHPDAVQVLDMGNLNALDPSTDEQVVSSREDGTVSVGGQTEQPWGTGNPVTRVGDERSQAPKADSKRESAPKKS